jgi:hypothetical protein
MLLRLRQRGDRSLVHGLRGPACQLIALIDAATRRIWGRFCEQDSAAENLRTLQDRLVKEMRLAGIDSIATANHFLETRFIRDGEQRFSIAARKAGDAQLSLGPEQHLEEILSVRVARRVAQEHTVSWEGKRWGVVREEVCAGLRGAAVESERRLDGSDWWRYRGALSAPAFLPRTGASDHPSFRPTASRTCAQSRATQEQNHTPIPCACRSPLEQTMEADISILRKPGHSYFALTQIWRQSGPTDTT